MKVAIIGSGNVGMSVFNEIRVLPSVSELVLIGIETEKIKGEIDDYLDAQALNVDSSCKLSYGDYSATAGADVIIYTAGVGRKPGQSRLDLAKTNVAIAKSVFLEIKKYNRSGIIIVISNPVDVITYVAAKLSGRPKYKVIGTGTLLDTGRLKRLIAENVDISTRSIHGYVIGEHGSSAVFVLSALRICNLSLPEFLSMQHGTEIKFEDKEIEDIKNLVKGAGARIISEKGSTSYGVAVAARRLVRAIFNDSHEILPVSTCCLDKYGVDNIAISVPCIIGHEGVLYEVPLKMTEEEQNDFAASCKVIKETIDETFTY